MKPSAFCGEGTHKKAMDMRAVAASSPPKQRRTKRTYRGGCSKSEEDQEQAERAALRERMGFLVKLIIKCQF
ncbi:hypothetical protein CORI_0527 [Campylobacter sp. CCUG 57310]|nr:hypothetical protein CORI_0527 [Campylobacter sp. CCUG 57310]